MSLEVAEFLLENFKGRENYIAYKKPNSHFKPHKLDKPITPQKFLDSHLNGDTCLGFYLLTTRNTVYCSCLDWDNHDGENPEAIKQGVVACVELFKLGFEPLLEISQSGKGCHVWLLFDGEQPAWLVRKFWQTFLAHHGPGGSCEIYPRQDNLQDMKLGNLIRYPLFNQSKFLHAYDGNDLSPIEINQGIQDGRIKATGDDLRRFLEEHEVSVESPSEDATEAFMGVSEGVVDGYLPERVRHLIESSPGSLLTCRWMAQTTGLYDGSYSGIMMSLAREFVRNYTPTDEIREALLYWCRLRGYEKPLERPDLIETTIDKAYDLIIDRKEKKVLTGNTFDTLAHDYADRVYQNEDFRIPTGIKALDASIGGFGFSELSVISARPSQGKTAFSLQCLDHASSIGFPCLLISLEMSARENSRRFLLRLSDGDTAEWKTEQGNQFLHEKIDTHFKNRMPIYFIEGAYEINRIEEVIDHYAQEYGVRMAVIDYQGLASCRDQIGEYAQQTEITKRLKKTAKRNDLALLSLVQTKRVEGDNPDREPQLSDLRSSGEIEQSADLVMFLRWPWKDDTSRNKEDYIMWLKKGRNIDIKEPRIDLFFDSAKQTLR